MGDMNTYRIVIVTPEVNRLLGNLKRRLEDNIKMYLEEIWLEGVD
jgi:hypothetical protein